MNILGLGLPRLNRRSFFLSVFASMFLFVGAGIILGSLLSAAVGAESTTDLNSPEQIVLTPFMIAAFLSIGACFVKRLHDLNMRGWWALGIFVPLVNLITLVLLFFSPGSKGENRFGASPKVVSLMGLTRKH